MTDFTLYKTEQTVGEQAIAAMEESNARYAATGAEYAANARALLMTVRRRMTGHEEEECEKATGDHDDPDGFDCCVIDRLVNQYSREIAKWKDGVKL